MGYWAKLHPEAHRKHQAAYYKRNADKERKRSAKQYESNPSAKAARQDKRRALQSKAGGSYTSKQWKNLCTLYENRCLCCEKKKKLTPDHVVPIARGGTSNIGNIQPLCLPCNKAKYTSTTDYRKLRKTQGDS